MKRAVLAFFLFALVVALIQYLLIRQKDIESAVYEQMGTAVRALESGDMELADEEFLRTSALWEHYEPHLVAIVGRLTPTRLPSALRARNLFWKTASLRNTSPSWPSFKSRSKASGTRSFLHGKTFYKNLIITGKIYPAKALTICGKHDIICLRLFRDAFKV
jgi:hypothetical protein